MKTIFFIINGKVDIKDLFTTEKGVFNVLCQKPDIRIVLLMPKGKYERHKHRLEHYTKLPNVTIEFINAYVPQGFVQKSFVFFSKYLIFTSTMHVLATKGVRTDVTLPKGRYYSYGVKILIHKLFGRSKWIKNSFVPFLFPIVFRKRPYKRLFDIYKPDLLFISDVKPFFGLLFLDEASRRKIKTMQMPGNWDHFKYYFPLQSDVMLTPNEPLKEEALDNENYKPSQIKVTGFPRFDFFTNKVNILSREEYLAKVEFKSDTKLVLFVSEGSYSLDGGDIVSMIIEWIEKSKLDSNTRVLLRPYPPYPGNWGEGEKFGKFEKSPLVYFDTEHSWYTEENMKNFVNLLYHSDVVVNIYSTVAVEALVFNKPVINIGFDGYQVRRMNQSVQRFVNLNHFKHVTDTGGVRTVTSEEELFEDLKKYLTNPESNYNKRQKARDRMCFSLDGKASERVVQYILDYLYVA